MSAASNMSSTLVKISSIISWFQSLADSVVSSFGVGVEFVASKATRFIDLCQEVSGILTVFWIGITDFNGLRVRHVVIVVVCILDSIKMSVLAGLVLTPVYRKELNLHLSYYSYVTPQNLRT
jgi:hypothetical protein